MAMTANCANKNTVPATMIPLIIRIQTEIKSFYIVNIVNCMMVKNDKSSLSFYFSHLNTLPKPLTQNAAGSVETNTVSLDERAFSSDVCLSKPNLSVI